MDKSETATTVDLSVDRKDNQKLIRGFIFACTEKSEAEYFNVEKME